MKRKIITALCLVLGGIIYTGALTLLMTFLCNLLGEVFALIMLFIYFSGALYYYLYSVAFAGAVKQEIERATEDIFEEKEDGDDE